MKKVLLSTILLVGSLFCQTTPTAVFFGPAKTVTVTANLAATGYTIPANFVGWSVEDQDLIGGYYAGTQTSFINLAKMLGTNGVIRFGGITSDLVALPALTQNIANGLGSFLTGLGSGWTIVYGLDACENNTTDAATQAGYLVTALGVSNIVFQVGNEPPFEVCGWTQSQWTTIFNAYYASIHGTYATSKWGGPDVTNNSFVQTYVNTLTPGVSGLTYVSTHWYPYGIGFSPVADQLISAVSGNDTVSTTNSFAFQENSSYASGKLVMTESSNRAGCGLQGVSDTLMASAWYLNLAMALSNDGWLGLYPHNAIMTCYGQAHNGYYNAFVLQGDGGFSPSPLFYGMYLFSQMEGKQTVTTTQTGASYLRTIAVKQASGQAEMLVQNNATTFPVNVIPAQSAAWTTANVTILTGTACNDKAPKLGGQPIQEGGVWTGTATVISNGNTISIPPCGAALISVRP